MNKFPIRLTALVLMVLSIAIVIFATMRDGPAPQGTSILEPVCSIRNVREKDVVENLRTIKSVMPLESKSNVCSKPIDEKITIKLTARPMNLVDSKHASQIASEKNQVMDELLNLPQIPSDYAETMIALFRDSTQDVVTRDFAVQHIGLYAQALNRRGLYDPKSAEAERCRAALYDAVDETGTIVAAAAFRALADVSEFDSSINVRRLNNALVRCASDESASLAARIMAVQLCGERMVKESKELLRPIASSSSAPKPLRLAAKHSIERL